MQLTQTHARFEETSYTLIGALQDDTLAESAASELVRVYWPPVYAYLRRSGKNRDSASELTQAFFSDVICGRKLLQSADPNKGNVRNLILTALKRYLIDNHRKEMTRGKGRLISFDSLAAEDQVSDIAEQEYNPSQAYNHRWAMAQLDEAMRRCESHFCSSGRERHWKAFSNRVYHPSVNNTTPTALKLLAPRLGFPSPADTAAAVQLVKRRSISFLREVIAESTAQPTDADAEYELIIKLLSNSKT